MTIYVTFKNGVGYRDRKRKNRRVWSTPEFINRRTRAAKAFSEQWKRYPNCRNIIDLRSGEKTNTNIFPRGRDQTFHGPYRYEFPPIKGK